MGLASHIGLPKPEQLQGAVLGSARGSPSNFLASECWRDIAPLPQQEEHSAAPCNSRTPPNTKPGQLASYKNGTLELRVSPMIRVLLVLQHTTLPGRPGQSAVNLSKIYISEGMHLSSVQSLHQCLQHPSWWGAISVGSVSFGFSFQLEDAVAVQNCLLSQLAPMWVSSWLLPSVFCL